MYRCASLSGVPTLGGKEGTLGPWTAGTDEEDRTWVARWEEDDDWEAGARRRRPSDDIWDVDDDDEWDEDENEDDDAEYDDDELDDG